MSKSKAGLADLKRLRASAQAAHEAAQKTGQSHSIARSGQHTINKAKPVTAEEARLFARATQLVEPLKSKRARVMHMPADKPMDADTLAQKRHRATGTQAPESQTQVSDGYTPISDTKEDIAWHAPGIGPDTLRKLRQAWWPIGSQIDLHGQTRDEARQALINFIEISQQHGTRCVRIIHGQGFGSTTGEGLLRSLVAQWLTQMNAISAFSTAPKAHGGRGALLALIRTS